MTTLLGLAVFSRRGKGARECFIPASLHRMHTNCRGPAGSGTLAVGAFQGTGKVVHEERVSKTREGIGGTCFDECLRANAVALLVHDGGDYK